MKINVTLSYDRKHEDAEAKFEVDAKINHIRTLPVLDMFGRVKKGQHRFGVTTLAFLRGERIITTNARMNPSDNTGYCKRAGIVSAMYNYVVHAFPEAKGNTLALVEANKEEDGSGTMNLEFVTLQEANNRGYLYELYWWLDRKTCPSTREQDARDARIAEAIEKGRAATLTQEAVPG